MSGGGTHKQVQRDRAQLPAPAKATKAGKASKAAKAAKAAKVAKAGRAAAVVARTTSPGRRDWAEHAYEFHIGRDLSPGLAVAAQELAAASGGFSRAEVRRLHRAARSHGHLDEVQRMFLAGLLDSDNARTLARAAIGPGTTIGFSLASIRAGMPAIKAMGRPRTSARAAARRPTERRLARQGRPEAGTPAKDDRDGGTPAKDDDLDAGTPGGDRAGGDQGSTEQGSLLAQFFAGLNELFIDSAIANPVLLRETLASLIAEHGMVETHGQVEQIRDEVATLRANRADISGVPAELGELNRKIDRRERFLAAIDAALAEFDLYVDLFEAQGLIIITNMLQLSLRRVLAEKGRYGLQTKKELVAVHTLDGPAYVFQTTYSMADNDQSKAMMTAAGQLAGKVVAIRQATDAVNNTMGMVPDPTVEGGLSWGVVDEKAHAIAAAKLADANRDYDALRYEKEAQFPILAAFTAIDRQGGTHAIDTTADKLRTIAAGGTGAAATLAADVDDRLAHIQEVREGVADGDIRVFEMPDIVELTKEQLGVKPNTAQARMIDDKVDAARTWKVAKDILLGVVTMALAFAAAPLTGGASLGVGAAVIAGTAAVASAGLTTYIAVEHLQEYELKKAEGGTDFDRARALTQDDPSLFWLALDIVAAVADVKAALTAFKELSVVVRASLAARRAAKTAEQIARVESREMAALRTAAAKRLGSADAAERVVKSAEAAAVSEQAELTGLAGKWESELNGETKALMEHRPDVAVNYRKMDPEVREVLTRCGSVCIPPEPITLEQQARLSKLLDKIPPRHRQGLQEFFYHHRDNLDQAIGDLEHLFSTDLGAEVEKAFSALEKGELPQKGELVSAGRTGSAEAVPDITKDVSLELVRRTQNVLGKSIAETPAEVQAAWRAATDGVIKDRGALTASNYATHYSEAQRRFWNNVRKDEGAVKWFNDNGFDFTRTQTGAPAVSIAYSGGRARKELAIELDHMLPKATGENWRKALDADNLQFLTGWDNWLLNQIERLDPALAR